MKFGSGRRPLRGLQASVVEQCEPRRLMAAAATFFVTNANDAGAGSLRQAISQANANLNDTNPDGTKQFDTIVINIQDVGGPADRVVELATPLPAITDPIYLGVPPAPPDGESPPPGPYLELNGSAAGAGANGLVLAPGATASQITGLAINRFSGNGIVIQSNNSGVSGFMHIGTDLAGTATNLGNAGNGILIQSDGNVVGDSKIVYNGGDGVAVEGFGAADPGTGNIISLNSAASEVHSNGGLAVDVGLNGVSPNDNLDADGGPNLSQNTPVLTSVSFSGNTVTVSGTINTTPDTFVSLDFFTTPLARREARQALKDQGGITPNVLTDASGNASFTVTLVPTNPAGTLSASSYITSVAMALDNASFGFNTSEFSAPLGGPRPWLAPGSAATWNAEGNTLTVTGAATIIADPAPESPVITANGAAAVLTINPSTGRAVHVGGLTLTGGATATLTSVSSAAASATPINAPTTPTVKGGSGKGNAKPKAKQTAAITATASALRTAENSRVLVVNGDTFNIDANSKLDLTDNNLILNYSGATPAAGVEGMVKAGYNGGDWLGNRITSSAANADRNFALAVSDNSQLTIQFNGTRLFAGQAVDSTSVLVKFTHRVDLDLDGVITTNDATIFNSNYSEGGTARWGIGDADFDGLFSTNDATLFNSYYNESLGAV